MSCLQEVWEDYQKLLLSDPQNDLWISVSTFDAAGQQFLLSKDQDELPKNLIVYIKDGFSASHCNFLIALGKQSQWERLQVQVDSMNTHVREFARNLHQIPTLHTLSLSLIHHGETTAFLMEAFSSPKCVVSGLNFDCHGDINENEGLVGALQTRHARKRLRFVSLSVTNTTLSPCLDPFAVSLALRHFCATTPLDSMTNATLENLPTFLQTLKKLEVLDVSTHGFGENFDFEAAPPLCEAIETHPALCEVKLPFFHRAVLALIINTEKMPEAWFPNVAEGSFLTATRDSKGEQWKLRELKLCFSKRIGLAGSGNDTMTVGDFVPVLRAVACLLEKHKDHTKRLSMKLPCGFGFRMIQEDTNKDSPFHVFAASLQKASALKVVEFEGPSRSDLIKHFLPVLQHNLSVTTLLYTSLKSLIGIEVGRKKKDLYQGTKFKRIFERNKMFEIAERMVTATLPFAAQKPKHSLPDGCWPRALELFSQPNADPTPLYHVVKACFGGCKVLCNDACVSKEDLVCGHERGIE